MAMKRHCGIKQEGISLVGLIVVLAVAGFVGILALKIVPTYSEYRAVLNAIKAAKATGGGVREIQNSFDANATVTPLHDRMPVVLGPEHFEAWLDCKTTELKAAQDMLQPAPDDLLEAIEMHPMINDSRRDEPGIQQPLQTQLLL